MWHGVPNDGGKPSKGPTPHVMKCRDVRDEVGGHDRGDGWGLGGAKTHTRRIPMKAPERDEKRALGLGKAWSYFFFLTLPGIPRLYEVPAWDDKELVSLPSPWDGCKRSCGR